MQLAVFVFVFAFTVIILSIIINISRKKELLLNCLYAIMSLSLFLEVYLPLAVCPFFGYFVGRFQGLV